MARFKDKNSRKNKEQSRKDFNREIDNKSKKLDIIIACEDKVSAPCYLDTLFSQLKKDRKIASGSMIIAKHKHTDPSGVLKDLKTHNENGLTYKDFTHQWIVIDRDNQTANKKGHTPQNFNNALVAAKKEDIRVAYSNDCFELWYLLHFDYIITPMYRDKILSRLIDKLKQVDNSTFDKLTKDKIKSQSWTKKIYNELLDKQENAIQNAEKLMRSYKHHNPGSDNPSTSMHLLVKLLLGR